MVEAVACHAYRGAVTLCCCSGSASAHTAARCELRGLEHLLHFALGIKSSKSASLQSRAMSRERFFDRHALLHVLLDPIVRRDDFGHQLENGVEPVCRNGNDPFYGVTEDDIALSRLSMRARILAKMYGLTGCMSTPDTLIGTSNAHGFASMPVPTVEVALAHSWDSVSNATQVST